MKSIAERYNRLAQAYLELSDKFHQLDVAHMSLRKKLVPAIKTLKESQALTIQLKQDKAKLEQTIQALTERQHSLQEALLTLQAKEVKLSKVITTLTEEKTELQATLQQFQVKYDALAKLESLLQPNPQAVLAEAEEQMALVEETFNEMALNSDPDLSMEEQKLIEAFQNDEHNLFTSEATSNTDDSLKVLDLFAIVA